VIARTKLSWYPFERMTRVRTLTLLGTLLLACTLLSSAVPLEKKYSLRGFTSLRWVVYPQEATVAEAGDKAWSLRNDSSRGLLLIGPYREENLELATTVRFSPEHPVGSVSVIFNVQPDYEAGERPTYMFCRISSPGKILFGAVHAGTEYAISEERFGPDREHPEEVRIDFVKKRERVDLLVNGRKRAFVDDAPLPPGGFGFLIAADTEVELSDFYFAKYGEKDIPFRGVDVKEFFGLE